MSTYRNQSKRATGGSAHEEHGGIDEHASSNPSSIRASAHAINALTACPRHLRAWDATRGRARWVRIACVIAAMLTTGPSCATPINRDHPENINSDPLPRLIHLTAEQHRQLGTAEHLGSDKWPPFPTDPMATARHTFHGISLHHGSEWSPYRSKN